MPAGPLKSQEDLERFLLENEGRDVNDLVAGGADVGAQDANIGARSPVW